MTIVSSQPFYTTVLGVDTPYTGFVRMFVPQGSLGYLGKDSCGCCGNGGCKDPRVILEFAEGILVGAYAYAGGSRKPIPFSSGGIELATIQDAPVQYLPATLSLDSELECPCKATERWTATGDTTFDDLNRTAIRYDPFARLREQSETILRLIGEVEDLRQANENLELIRTILRSEKEVLETDLRSVRSDLAACELRSPRPPEPTPPEDVVEEGPGEGPPWVAPPVPGSAFEDMVKRAYGSCVP